MDLTNTIALVTGGAHRVGKGIALALAQAGAHLVIHYGGSADAAAQTAAEIQALGREAITHQADLADPEAITALFRAVEARFGRLDVLVNSAASFKKERFSSITIESWQGVLDVNLRAPFLCSQHAYRLMHQSIEQRGAPGAIVNIADLSGAKPWPGYTQHGVSKAGLLHLTRITAYELSPNVRVNAIMPGPILPPAGATGGEAYWQRTLARVPLQREGTVAEVGHAVVFLAENDYITGVDIAVDGGEHLLNAKD